MMVQSERLKELQVQFEQTTKAKEKISALLDWCAEMRLYDLDKALELANNALQRAEQETFQLGIGRAHYALGSCYWQKGEYAVGINHLHTAIDFAKQIKDNKLLAKCNNILGNIYRDKGEMNEALRGYMIALDLFEQLKDEHTSGVVMKNLANLNIDLYDYENALNYGLKSVKILEQFENPFRLFHSYHTLGNIYFKQDNYEEALKYFYKCKDLADMETITSALAESGLGKVYFQQGNLPKAKKYLEHAFALADSNDFVEPYIIASFYLARLAQSEKQFSEAEKFYQLAFTEANTHGRKHDTMSIHEQLANLYEEQNKFEQAYFHLKHFENLREEIFKQDTINRLKNIQTRNELSFARKEKEIAEQTAVLKQQFMANMSHEIRTPMNAIIGMSRLLSEKEHLPHQLKYLNGIKRSADNLLVIINDILDISKLEAEKVQLENIAFNLRDTLQSVYDILQFKAVEKRLGFYTDIEQGVPIAIHGDTTRLSQVLINLAGNAIKFTEKGRVDIKVRVKSREDNQVIIKFEIQDTGIGISQEYVNTLFEKFTQAGTDIARKYGGTGLGLSISKQLVSLMKGDIYVKSKKNEGTTFTIEIPFTIAMENEIQSDEQFTIQKQHKHHLEQLNILLVEDNEFNQILAIDTLVAIAPNIKIKTAVNGEEAINFAQQQLFDLILMDIQMPIMNGVEATQYIRSILQPPYSEVKILAMTANVFKEDIDTYLKAGMNDAVSKPFSTEVLIHKMLKLTEGVSAKLRNAKVESEASNITRYTNMDFLNSFTKGDAAKKKKYIQLFLDNAPLQLSNIENGLANTDYAAIKIAAHSLKSLLNYMGVQEEVSNVYALEKACQQESEYTTIPAMIAQLKKVAKKVFAELESIKN
jgi:signal transduction histidine kinase/CheY-like chemotaxis protein/HPt (histidine-containing phosphotransfer) domain-containing protein